MDIERLLEAVQQALEQFETQKVVAFIREVNMKTFIENPKVTCVLVLLTIYGIWRWSRFVLLFLFTVLSLSALIMYALPAANAELTIKSTLPFVFGCMGIASVLLYFLFIRAK